MSVVYYRPGEVIIMAIVTIPTNKACNGSHTLAELVEAFQAEYLPDMAPETQRTFRWFCARILQDFGGALPLERITPVFLRSWKRHLSQKLKPGTANQYMTRLGILLNAAHKDLKWIEVNPLADVRKPRPDPGRTRFLTDDERVCLLAACRKSQNHLLFPIVVVALCTGGRKSEVRKLQWSAVDLDNRLVRFLLAKGRKSRSVPLVGEAYDLLQELHQSRRPAVPWVFPGPSGMRPRDINSSWYTALRRAGLEDFRFHDLRHTAASYLAMSGATLKDIADILGHAHLHTTARYTHLTQSHTASVLDRMANKYLNDQSPQA
jgi:integrase